MTVKRAVLEAVLEHYPNVPNHLIAQAHPGHPLSGLQRLRELKASRVLAYRFDRHTNRYQISTPREKLLEALESL